MQIKTLEELKRENAEQETEAELQTEEVEEEALGLEEVEDSEDSEAPEELEPWMQAEDNSEDGQSMPVAKHVSVKRKLKGKISEKDDEISKLREEINSLREARPQAQDVSADKPKPKLEDFQHLDNPEEAYADALTDWKLEKFEAKQQAQNLRNRQDTESRRVLETINTSVDQHYERAEQLVEKSGISPDRYQQADVKVRQAIEAIRPGQGDAVVDQLIAELGEGSEKVMYYTGSNEAVLATLQSKLVSNPSGLSAMAYLAEIKATKAAPQKKQSRAPKPAPDVKGDSKPTANEGKLKKAYEKARGQDRWDLRQQARAAGFNVKEW